MWGSPPRVRELPDNVITDFPSPRITPACAGITGKPRLDSLLIEDHPRVCGNYIEAWLGEQVKAGSPPRVRELPEAAGPVVDVIGITPACAGITAAGGCL